MEDQNSRLHAGRGVDHGCHEPLNRIKEVMVINGEYELVLQGGVRIALSRTYRDEFFARLGDAKPRVLGLKKK